LTSSFHAHLLESMDHAAQKEGYSIFLACSYRDPDKEQELIEMMLGKGVDGIIIAPTSVESPRAVYSRLTKDGVAVVFVDRDLPKVRIDCVSVDNFAGGRLAAAHLIERGRKNVAFVTMVYKGQQSSTLQERLSGCNYALQSAGLAKARVLGLEITDEVTGETVGYKAVAKALSGGKLSFDGLFTANDNLAYGAITAIREAGLKIPQDVAVVGFDDQDPSAFVDPPLTTIRQPVHSVGAAAVEKLLSRLGADSAADIRERARVKIEPTLIQRSST
jgi:LacI family transcriptional regulator